MQTPLVPADSSTRRTRGPQRCLLATVTLLCALVTTIATSTTVVTVDADRLVGDATQIVHVRCRDCVSYRNDDGLIVTRYQFEVLDTLKGSPVTTLECVQPGGRIGNIVTVVPGLTTYRPDHEFVLFLSPANPNTPYRLPVGLDQGVYRITTEPGSDAQVARRDLSRLHQLPAATGADFKEGLAVDDFKAQVRARVLRQQKEQPAAGTGR